MEVTLYLDVFFLTNLGMDLLLLWMTAKILRIPVHGKRLAAAAALGAGGACILVMVWHVWLPGMSDAGVRDWLQGVPDAGGRSWLAQVAGVLELLAGWGILPAGMLLTAFRPSRLAEWGRQLTVLWIAGAAAGGIFEAVSFGNHRSTLRFLCCAAGVCLGGRAAVLFLQESMRIQKNLYEVTLYYHGRTGQLTALWDTGNQLYEPYGHRPVHVVTREAAAQLCETVDRVIYIPFSAVGTGYGVLPGIQLDAMDVRKEGVLVRHCEMPWIAVSREPLSVRHQYEMLLHGETPLYGAAPTREAR